MLRSAQFETERQRESVKVAKSKRLPSIEASLSGSYIGNQTSWNRRFSDKTTIETPHVGSNFSLDLLQPIYSGDLISGTIHLAELKLQLAILQRESTGQELRFSLAEAYLGLCKLENQKNYSKQAAIGKVIIAGSLRLATFSACLVVVVNLWYTRYAKRSYYSTADVEIPGFMESIPPFLVFVCRFSNCILSAKQLYDPSFALRYFTHRLSELVRISRDAS